MRIPARTVRFQYNQKGADRSRRPALHGQIRLLDRAAVKASRQETLRLAHPGISRWLPALAQGGSNFPPNQEIVPDQRRRSSRCVLQAALGVLSALFRISRHVTPPLEVTPPHLPNRFQGQSSESSLKSVRFQTNMLRSRRASVRAKR
jgi:hypothetical protein